MHFLMQFIDGVTIPSFIFPPIHHCIIGTHNVDTTDTALVFDHAKLEILLVRGTECRCAIPVCYTVTAMCSCGSENVEHVTPHTVGILSSVFNSVANRHQCSVKW